MMSPSTKLSAGFLLALAPRLAFGAAILLLLVGTGAIVWGTRYTTELITDSAVTEARILASTVSAALAFDDPRAAQEYVNALSANPSVEAVAVYQLNGRRFVAFSRNSASRPPLKLPRTISAVNSDNLTVVVPVEQGRQTLGSIYLETATVPLARRLLRIGLIALLVAMTALVILVLGLSQRALAAANRQLDTRAQELARANAELRSEIDHRLHTEAELRQAQKMESLGQLTGGIAHDFNNLLQVISGNLEMLKRRSARWSIAETAAQDLKRLVDGSLEGAKRASALTQQLLAFSRRQPLAPTAVNVNKLVGGVTQLLERTLGELITVEVVLGAGAWMIFVDTNQLENAILNLAVNARDAMPDGGKLTIETSNTYLDADYAARQGGLKEGQYVAIAVTDTGTGMSAETAAQAFEPFFTTKEVGRGSGLGLSQVYGFTKQSGGHVKIYSEPDQGTTVRLYLPRHHAVAEETNSDAIESVPAGIAPAGIVLVVEDEEGVRRASIEMLRELGYTVHGAGDGPSALRILEKQPHIDLLFTDVILPGGLNGRQLADEALKRYPRLRVLYTTGYARNAIVHHGRLDPGVALLGKPFSYSALAQKVAEVLRQPSGG